MTDDEYGQFILDSAVAIIGATHQDIDVYDNFEALTDAEDVEDLLAIIDTLANMLVGVLESQHDDEGVSQFLTMCTSRRDRLSGDSNDSGDV